MDPDLQIVHYAGQMDLRVWLFHKNAWVRPEFWGVEN